MIWGILNRTAIQTAWFDRENQHRKKIVNRTVQTQIGRYGDQTGRFGPVSDRTDWFGCFKKGKGLGGSRKALFIISM